MCSIRAVVVIPVHSATPSADELFSFAQCYKILSSHDIVVLCPEGLLIDRYKELVPHLISIAIPSKWLSSIAAYNQLKCSPFFYKLFERYDYLLTYELDAFVFRDELAYWCRKGYSYIGAPWFEGYASLTPPFAFKGVGNSGFSLRNVQVCLRILNRINRLNQLNNALKSIAKEPTLLLLFLIEKGLSRFFKIRNTKFLPNLIHGSRVNEDIFWSEWSAYTFSDFELAPVDEAIKFSFELRPEYLFNMNDKRLPFGCHAWKKYNFPFWKPYLAGEGDQL
jgi:hypothetical protein